jgi:hypothetical protein
MGESLRMSRKQRQGRAPAAVVVSDSQVRECVGCCVTVEGLVASVTTSVAIGGEQIGAAGRAPSRRGVRVLTFGPPSPRHTLSVWIASDAYLPMVEALRGRLVRITGPVWLHDGRWPAVTVVDPRQLEVVRER